MRCEECEPLLAQDEAGSEVEAHLAGCRNCRSLAAELQANAHAMRALGAEVMPPVTIPVPGVPWWKWSSAAAALIITLTAAWWASRPPKVPQIVSVDVKVTGVVPTQVAPVPAKIPEKLTPARVPIAPVAYKEPLRVKMLTPDPDVVIYWLVDPKGE
jgi:hypothetical protein